MSSEMRMCWMNKHKNVSEYGRPKIEVKVTNFFSVHLLKMYNDYHTNQRRLLHMLFSDWSKFKSCSIHWLNIYALEMSSRVPCCSSVFSLFLLMVSEVVEIVVSATRTRKHVNPCAFLRFGHGLG